MHPLPPRYKVKTRSFYFIDTVPFLVVLALVQDKQIHNAMYQYGVSYCLVHVRSTALYTSSPRELQIRYRFLVSNPLIAVERQYSMHSQQCLMKYLCTSSIHLLQNTRDYWGLLDTMYYWNYLKLLEIIGQCRRLLEITKTVY